MNTVQACTAMSKRGSDAKGGGGKKAKQYLPREMVVYGGRQKQVRWRPARAGPQLPNDVWRAAATLRIINTDFSAAAALTATAVYFPNAAVLRHHT